MVDLMYDTMGFAVVIWGRLRGKVSKSYADWEGNGLYLDSVGEAVEI